MGRETLWKEGIVKRDPKARRRAGEGSLRSYETGAGERWLIAYRIRDPQTDTRRQVLRRGFTTQRKATQALREVLVKADAGTYVEPSKQPLGEYLTAWLDGLRLAPSTVASYRKNVRLHVAPYLGGMPLAGLTATDINGLYRRLETDGRRDGGAGGLAPRTVRYVGTILHAALKDAVREGRLVANPADKATPPSARQAAPPEMHVWDGEQLRAFLDWSERTGDELYPLWTVLAVTGMRRGEALALRWGDVNFAEGTVAVRRSVGVVKNHGAREEIVFGAPKSGRARVIEVDGRSMAMLRAYRAERATISLMLARDDAPLLGTADGKVRHPERVTRAWEARQQKIRADLGDTAPPRIRLHDLRHTHATILLRGREHPKVVSERLGHSKIGITLDTYSHAVPAMGREAAAKFAALVYG